MNEHLIFFDGACGFCDKAVQFVLKKDVHKKFLFAPLQGETAQNKLSSIYPDYKKLNTLVLLENVDTPHQKIHLLGKASFRILWLLGSYWRLIGWIYFLPGFLYNWGYRLVADHRSALHRILFNDSCDLKGPSDRFLK